METGKPPFGKEKIQNGKFATFTFHGKGKQKTQKSQLFGEGG